MKLSKYENSFHGFIGSYVDSYAESQEAMFECVVCMREAFGMGELAYANSKASHDSTSSI